MDGVGLVQARNPAERETPVTAVPQAPVAAAQGASCGMGQGSGSSSLSWMGKHRGWVFLGGAAVAGTGLALGEGWVTVAGLAPLLYAAPCAAMMFFCMKGMSGGMQGTQNQAQNQTLTPAAVPDTPQAMTETEKQT